MNPVTRGSAIGRFAVTAGSYARPANVSHVACGIGNVFDEEIDDCIDHAGWHVDPRSGLDITVVGRKRN